MLLVGNEGEGLRPFLKKLAKFCVSLEKGSGTDSLVDSLNVSFFFFFSFPRLRCNHLVILGNC